MKSTYWPSLSSVSARNRMTIFIKAKLKKSDKNKRILQNIILYRNKSSSMDHYSKIHDDKAFISCLPNCISDSHTEFEIDKTILTCNCSCIVLLLIIDLLAFYKVPNSWRDNLWKFEIDRTILAWLHQLKKPFATYGRIIEKLRLKKNECGIYCTRVFNNKDYRIILL